jgi:hypothetical protein
MKLDFFPQQGKTRAEARERNTFLSKFRDVSSSVAVYLSGAVYCNWISVQRLSGAACKQHFYRFTFQNANFSFIFHASLCQTAALSGLSLASFSEFHLQNSSCSPAAAAVSERWSESVCVGAPANMKHAHMFLFPTFRALFRLIIGGAHSRLYIYTYNTDTTRQLRRTHSEEINAWAFQVVSRR